jgi:hypothetical protein
VCRQDDGVPAGKLLIQNVNLGNFPQMLTSNPPPRDENSHFLSIVRQLRTDVTQLPNDDSQLPNNISQLPV